MSKVNSFTHFHLDDLSVGTIFLLDIPGMPFQGLCCVVLGKNNHYIAAKVGIPNMPLVQCPNLVLRYNGCSMMRVNEVFLKNVYGNSLHEFALTLEQENPMNEDISLTNDTDCGIIGLSDE